MDRGRWVQPPGGQAMSYQQPDEQEEDDMTARSWDLPGQKKIQAMQGMTNSLFKQLINKTKECTEGRRAKGAKLSEMIAESFELKEIQTKKQDDEVFKIMGELERKLSELLNEYASLYSKHLEIKRVICSILNSEDGTGGVNLGTGRNVAPGRSITGNNLNNQGQNMMPPPRAGPSTSAARAQGHQPKRSAPGTPNIPRKTQKSPRLPINLLD